MSMKGGLLANARVREATVSAVITRADGTREELGVIAEWHRNPVLRLLRAIKRKIREFFRW